MLDVHLLNKLGTYGMDEWDGQIIPESVPCALCLVEDPVLFAGSLTPSLDEVG